MFSDIRAVLLDIDGTVLDTSDYIIRAFKHVLTTHGISRTDAEIRSVIGKPLITCYELLSGYDTEGASVLAREHHLFQENHLELVKPFTHTKNTLECLQSAGLAIAACTTRTRESLHITLKHAGIFEYFDALICPEDTEKYKPDPEPLLLALERVNVMPAHAVMVGDSHVDVGAGKNAGTKTVRCTYGINDDYLHEPEPDVFIDDIKELPTLLNL